MQRMYLRSLLKHVLRITHVITCILNVAFGQGLAGDTYTISFIKTLSNDILLLVWLESMLSESNE